MQNNIMETAWEFVEKYYPNYSGCSEIAENNDLQCIVDNEVEADSCAEELYNDIKEELENLYGSVEDFQVIEEAQKRLYKSNAYVYERAIEGYLETVKNS